MINLALEEQCYVLMNARAHAASTALSNRYAVPDCDWLYTNMDFMHRLACYALDLSSGRVVNVTRPAFTQSDAEAFYEGGVRPLLSWAAGDIGEYSLSSILRAVATGMSMMEAYAEDQETNLNAHKLLVRQHLDNHQMRIHHAIQQRNTGVYLQYFPETGQDEINLLKPSNDLPAGVCDLDLTRRKKRIQAEFANVVFDGRYAQPRKANRPVSSVETELEDRAEELVDEIDVNTHILTGIRDAMPALNVLINMINVPSAQPVNVFLVRDAINERRAFTPA